MRNPFRYVTSPARIDASCAGDECDNDVRGVTVEVLASPVIDRCRAGVGVAGGKLDVPQRNTGIKRSHTERSTKHVRVHVPETGAFADRSDPPMRSTPIKPGTVTTHQDWPITALTDSQIDGPCGTRDERDHRRLVALADDPQCPVTAVEAKIIDVRVACLADPEPVQTKQDRQSSVLTDNAFGSEQEPSKFGAVEPVALSGMNFGSADVLSRVRSDSSIDAREPVQAAHGRESTVDR